MHRRVIFLGLKAGQGCSIVECVDGGVLVQKAATPELYKTASTTLGGSAVAVPGELKGLEELHRKHGRLPWKGLFEEAIALARDGMPMFQDLREVGSERFP